MSYESLGHTKRDIALQLKRTAGLTLAELAGRLGISREAVRIQINEMIHDGWIARGPLPVRDGKAGRPATSYRLTDTGQHLFPKHYDALAQRMLEVLAAREGSAQLEEMLATLTEGRLLPWRERLAGLPLEEKLAQLKDLYWDGDPFTDLQRSDGGWMLTEHNCPFLNVALRQPALCSTTVNLLARLLGVQVVREQRFQDGANRCVFRILSGQAHAAQGFEREPERAG